MTEETTINVEKSVRNRLFRRKKEPTETYSDVLDRLMEQTDE